MQAECPSCYSTNSVKALKGNYLTCGVMSVKWWCASDVCLSSTSGLRREQRPRKTKIGSPHHTWLRHHFQGQKVKGQLADTWFIYMIMCVWRQVVFVYHQLCNMPSLNISFSRVTYMFSTRPAKVMASLGMTASAVGIIAPLGLWYWIVIIDGSKLVSYL